jgi:tetratricopeptide (TPR) repeat protein
MRRWEWVALLGLAIAVLLVYGNSLGGDFCYDENIVILRNDNVQDPDRIWALWSDTYWGSGVAEPLDSRGWRPLTIFTFHLNHRIGGNDPFVYHFTNVLLHAAATILLFLALVRLRFGPLVAVSAASLFALHAVHTESVAQIVGRSELLAGACALVALLMHLKAFPVEKPPPTARWAWIAGAALTLLMGLLGKESAVGFYALVLASDIVRTKGSTPRDTALRVLGSRWKAWLVYMAPLAAFLALRLALFGRAFPSGEVHFVDNPIAALSPLLRPLASLVVFGKSLSLLLVPAALSADYGYAQLPVERFWASGLFWFGLLALGAMVWKCTGSFRGKPAALWGCLAFLLAFFPVSNAVFLIHTILGERVLYVPSIGFCVLAGAAFSEAASSSRTAQRTTAWTILALILLFNAIRTPLRNRDWRDDLTLFDATAKVSSNSVRVLNNYGNVLYTRGDIDGAEEQYRRALELFPDYDDARVNLAGALIRRGSLGEARELLEKVLERNPSHAIAISNMELLERLEKPTPPGGRQDSSSPRSGPPRRP